MELPTRKEKPQTPLGRANILLYAPAKFGKTTFCSRFPEALFLATEPGLNQIECYKLDIRSWNDMREAYTLLKESKHNFKTIVIDTLDNAYKYCAQSVCDQHGVDHEDELDWGARGKIGALFERFLLKLKDLPYTIVLVSHEQEKEFGPKGSRIKKMIPSLSLKQCKNITGMVDVILFGQMVTGEKGVEQRVIKTRPCSWHEAGDRTGYLPDRLPLDGDKFVEVYNKGYQAAIAAAAKQASAKQQVKTNK